MSVEVISERLRTYECKTDLEEFQAVREITQEVILAALGRGDFFKHALFQGGTSLRIFYGLNRFSEDMDFLLRRPDPGLNLKNHIAHVTDELKAYGYDIEIVDRSRADTTVKKAFLKDGSLGRVIDLRFSGRTGPVPKIRIKLEVDTNPPAGSGEQLQYMDFPFVSAVAVQDLESLFAGKTHALLCREYIKGRDWYDFIWYSGRKAGINYGFLTSAIDQNGPWEGQGVEVDKKWLVGELEAKIQSIDWKKAAEDVRRFVRSAELPSLDLWNQELFLHQLEKLKPAL